MTFRVQPHMRLHEWVADEAGFFRDEGLDYEFETDGFAAGTASGEMVTPAGEQPAQVRSGAFEDMAQGRSSDVSCACHWAVNAASAADHGKMYGLAYSVCPSGIFVAPGSPCRQPSDLAGVQVSVGYHSGSHYSAIQGLEPFMDRGSSRSPTPGTCTSGRTAGCRTGISSIRLNTAPDTTRPCSLRP